MARSSLPAALLFGWADKPISGRTQLCLAGYDMGLISASGVGLHNGGRYALGIAGISGEAVRGALVDFIEERGKWAAVGPMRSVYRSVSAAGARRCVLFVPKGCLPCASHQRRAAAAVRFL